MNVQTCRRNSVFENSAVVSRLASLEKLRRIIFAPVRRDAVKLILAVAVALTGTSVFAQTEEAATLTFDPSVDVTVDEGQTLDLHTFIFWPDYWQYADNTITLNGGKVQAPWFTDFCDTDSGTGYCLGCFAGVNGAEPHKYNDSRDKIIYEAFCKWQFDVRNGLEGSFFSEEDYLNVCETGEDTTGTSYVEPLYVHKLDVKSGELEVGYSNLSLNSIETTGDFVKSGYGSLLIEDVETVFYERDEDGNLVVDENGTYTPRFVVTDSVSTFGGKVNVVAGDLYVDGNSDFNGEVVVGTAYDVGAMLYAVDGNISFKENVQVINGNLIVGHYGGAPSGSSGSVVFDKDVSVTGYVVNDVYYGSLLAMGDVTFNGNVYIGGDESNYQGAKAYFAVDSYTGANCKFDEESKVTIDGKNTFVAANAQCFDVDVDMKGGNLYFYNLLSNDTGQPNLIYVTYDENDVPTYLEWEAARKCIEDAKDEGKVLTGDITGNGDIFCSSYRQYTGEITTSVNGYTLVMDGGDKSFTGSTCVSSAILALKGGTSYGEVTSDAKNIFSVYGESYIPVLSKNGLTTWEVVGCGVLAFYRDDEDDPNVAPSVSANFIQLHDGYSYGVEGEVIGGTRLWLDASTPDADSQNVALGSFNANYIQIGSKTKVWYDHISTMKEGVSGTFELNAPYVGIIEGNSTHDATIEEIENIFSGAQLVDATYETDGLGKGTVTVKARNVADYASDMTQKERDYAAKLDANRITPNADTPFYDALYNETDEGKVRQTIHNLSIGGYRMLNAYGHFGNPTSSFFGGSTISAEHKRAQSIDVDYDPSYGNGEQPRQQSAIASTPVDNSSRAIWGAYTNTTVDGDEYDNDGMTMNGYRLRRQGIVGGLRRQIDGSTSGGLFFGLSNPEIDSNGQIQGGYGNYGSRMEMDDFQFAGHFEKVVGDFWEISAYVGGGTQAMDWRRDLYLNEGGRYQFKADGTGNTLTGTLYLANRIDLSDNLTFRPTVGVDSEHSWIYGFNEIQTIGGTVDEVNTYMRWLAQSYAYDQTYYNRNTARAGARVNWDGRAGIAGLNAQAFYAVKLGGKASPLISYRSENYSFDNMETHAMGGESFSVGGGGFLNLNRTKTLTATGDFNAVWYKNATTQNVTGGLTYRF